MEDKKRENGGLVGNTVPSRDQNDGRSGRGTNFLCILITHTLSLYRPHFHIIQRRPMPQPRNLALMVRMNKLRLPLRPIHLPHPQDTVLPGLQLVGSQDIQLVLDFDVIVSRGIGERQREHSLLLEVGLVNAGKAAGYHGHSTEISRLQCGVLAAGALAIVPVAEDAPSDACIAVALCDSRDCIDCLCGEVESLAAESLGVDGGFCAGEEVVRDVLEVAAVFVPRAGG